VGNRRNNVRFVHIVIIVIIIAVHITILLLDKEVVKRLHMRIGCPKQDMPQNSVLVLKCLVSGNRFVRYFRKIPIWAIKNWRKTNSSISTQLQSHWGIPLCLFSSIYVLVCLCYHQVFTIGCKNCYRLIFLAQTLHPLDCHSLLP